MKRILIVSLLFAAAAGCDKEDDKFADAPAVTAPQDNTPDEPGKASTEEDDTKDLPSGHPPIGEDSAIPKPPTVRFASPDQYGKTGPLRWIAPSGWNASRPASNMRLAEYIIAGQPEAAVVTVFYFGPGGGGGVDANVDRWVGQFDDGKAKPDKGERTVAEMKVHTVDVSGTYNPGMAGGGAPPKANHRMLGAIVESEAGLFFFKLVGPKAVVGEQQSNWDAFVGSFTKG